MLSVGQLADRTDCCPMPAWPAVRGWVMTVGLGGKGGQQMFFAWAKFANHSAGLKLARLVNRLLTASTVPLVCHHYPFFHISPKYFYIFLS